MEFIHTEAGEIPYHRVLRLEDRKSGDGPWKKMVYYETEDGVDCSIASYFDEEETGQIVPALPGYFKVGLYVEDGISEVLKEPIVAWVCNGLTASPVCLQMPCSQMEDILLPDGCVFDPENRDWESLEHYKTDEDVIKKCSK